MPCHRVLLMVSIYAPNGLFFVHVNFYNMRPVRKYIYIYSKYSRIILVVYYAHGGQISVISFAFKPRQHKILSFLRQRISSPACQNEKWSLKIYCRAECAWWRHFHGGMGISRLNNAIKVEITLAAKVLCSVAICVLRAPWH